MRPTLCIGLRNHRNCKECNKDAHHDFQNHKGGDDHRYQENCATDYADSSDDSGATSDYTEGSSDSLVSDHPPFGGVNHAAPDIERQGQPPIKQKSDADHQWNRLVVLGLTLHNVDESIRNTNRYGVKRRACDEADSTCCCLCSYVLSRCSQPKRLHVTPACRPGFEMAEIQREPTPEVKPTGEQSPMDSPTALPDGGNRTIAARSSDLDAVRVGIELRKCSTRSTLRRGSASGVLGHLAQNRRPDHRIDRYLL